LSLSKYHAEHIKNWRAHLKHERARRNRSFARSVFWLTLNSSRNFFGTLEFAGRRQDCDAVCCCLALLDEPVWFCLRVEPKREYLAAIALRRQFGMSIAEIATLNSITEAMKSLDTADAKTNRADRSTEEAEADVRASAAR
jgi:hypothetical protein